MWTAPLCRQHAVHDVPFVPFVPFVNDHLPYVTHPSYVIHSRQLRRHSAHCTALHRAPQFIPSSGLHGWMGQHATYQMRAALDPGLHGCVLPQMERTRCSEGLPSRASSGTYQPRRVRRPSSRRFGGALLMASSAWAILWGNRPPLLRKPSDTQYATYVGFNTTLWCTRRRPAFATTGTGPASRVVCSGSGGAFHKARPCGLGYPAWVPRCAPSVSSAGPDRSGIGGNLLVAATSGSGPAGLDCGQNAAT